MEVNQEHDVEALEPIGRGGKGLESRRHFMIERGKSSSASARFTMRWKGNGSYMQVDTEFPVPSAK